MESESQYAYHSQRVGLLSLSLGGLGQVATTNSMAQEDILSLQLRSWNQVVKQASFGLDKTKRGSSVFLESLDGHGLRNGNSPQFHTSAAPEEGLSLTLGIPNSFASGGLSSLNCDSLRLDRGKHIDDDVREQVYMDLGLSLATRRECHLTNLPFVSQAASLAVDMETFESWQHNTCGAQVHGNSSSAEEAQVLRRTRLPCNDSSKAVDLQLGLSASSLSDCFSDLPLDAQEARADALTSGRILVVDEGSTSARLMKSGGNMVSFLQSRLSKESSSSVHSQACGMLLGAGETDIVMQPASNELPAEDGESAGVLEEGRDISQHGGDPSVRLHGQARATSSMSFPAPERSTKTCKFKGCCKGARGASGLCIAHGGGRRCQRLNCNKGAEGRTMFCKAHGGGRRCQSLGCIKSAEGRTDFCIAHGGGRRCTFEGCSKAARGRSGLCIRHGGGKRCQREGCTKSAEGFSGLCISHGGGRRCQYPDCGKGAQGSTKFCKGHGGGRRCEFEACTKGAEGSTPFCKAHGGGKRCTFGGGVCTKSVHGGTAFCVAHGGGKRCSVAGCTKSARGRTDYCVRHGGGKRCKVEDCNKSAQGSTDYCKAHGGGKRCLWGQEGSVYDGSMLDDASLHGLKALCDKFARGKAGLCSAHSTLLEQYHSFGHGFSSGSSLQGSVSEQLQHPQPHSDMSEQTSRLDDEHSFTVENQLGSVGEGSLRPENELSCPVVFKAQAASRRCVATDASWQDTIIGGFSLEQSSPSEDLTCGIRGQDTSFHNGAAGNTLHNPLVHMLQDSEACCQHKEVLFQNDHVSPSATAQMQRVGADTMQHYGDSVQDAALFEDPEGRVHGGGHFMALLTRKASGHS